MRRGAAALGNGVPGLQFRSTSCEGDAASSFSSPFQRTSGEFHSPAGGSRRRSRWHRPLLLAGLLLALAPVHAAVAHSFEPAVLDVREAATGIFDVIWKLPGPESGSFAPGDALPQPVLPSHCRSLSTSTGAPAQLGELVSWRVDCGVTGLHDQPLAVRELGPRLEVIVRITWLDGQSGSAVLRSAAEEMVLPAPRTASAPGRSAGNVAFAYVRIGIEHILFGADHLLFVLGLMLLVDSLGMLVKTISAFTVAHSLALALAVLGVVEVPPALVEALIALSIVLVALELTRRTAAPTVTKRYPWAIAFAFGLLHGLGFAGALTSIGLPHDQLVLALFAFNVGVEIGQLLFVVAMLAPRAWLRRVATRWTVIELVPAYAIGSLAFAWMLERIGRFWMPPS